MINTPAETSVEWYDQVYHAALRDPAYKIDPKTSHGERDAGCLTALGVEKTHDILVCGCGGGDNVQLLKNKFGVEEAKIRGFDFSMTAVDFCQRTFPEASFTRAPANILPYPAGLFDRILAMDITEHLTHQVYLDFLWEALAVARKGGRIAVLPGITMRPEHINVIPLGLIVADMVRIGWKIVNVTPVWAIGEKL